MEAARAVPARVRQFDPNWSRNGLGALIFMGFSSSGGIRWIYGELVMRRKRYSVEENVCEHRAADPAAKRRAGKQGDVLPPER